MRGKRAKWIWKRVGDVMPSKETRTYRRMKKAWTRMSLPEKLELIRNEKRLAQYR